MKQEDKKILKWRLSEKPSVTSIKELVDSKIITTAEARQIILEETEYNSKSFQEVLDEIKLLRGLVMKLSENQPTAIIKYLQSYPVGIYDHQTPWYKPYTDWCINQSISNNSQISSKLN